MIDVIDPQWHSRLEAICTAYDLGAVQTVSQATRGMNNQIFIVNDRYAIRFDGLYDREMDGLDPITESRFVGEKVAYDALAKVGVPVPTVIAVDTSRRFALGDVLIMSKVRGESVKDSVGGLSSVQRERLGWQFGQALANMHAVTFPKFGRLRALHTRPLGRWVEWSDEFFNRYITRIERQHTLDPVFIGLLRAAYAKHRPLLEAVPVGTLIHGDAHPENVLQEDGELTGIIDFEWAYSGDRSADFQIEDQWAALDPAFLPAIYAGYQAIRALPPDHATRTALYLMLRELDSTAETKDDPDDARYQVHFDRAIKSLKSVLRVLV